MSATVEDVKNLEAEFPQEDIHWRAQTLTKDGSRALALAYLDARNVMERLDSVLGMANWQDRYEVHGAKTICYLSINIEGEWITKADGAGDTQVEAEKGSISDAFKRAAVKWGIGRYLYALDAVWVPCDTYDRGGKPQFSKFTADPWDFVKGAKQPPKANAIAAFDTLIKEMRNQGTVKDLAEWKDKTSVKAAYNKLPNDWKTNFADELAKQKEALTNARSVAV